MQPVITTGRKGFGGTVRIGELSSWRWRRVWDSILSYPKTGTQLRAVIFETRYTLKPLSACLPLIVELFFSFLGWKRASVLYGI